MSLLTRPVRPNVLLYAGWGLFALSMTLPSVWMPEYLGVPAGHVAGAVCAWVAALNLGDLLAMTADSYMGLLTLANVLLASSLLWRRRARGEVWPAVAFVAATAAVAGTPLVFARSSSSLLSSLVFSWGYYVWLLAFAFVAAHFAAHVRRRSEDRLEGKDHPTAAGPEGMLITP